jgi:uncharacterized membrane protein YfcA
MLKKRFGIIIAGTLAGGVTGLLGAGGGMVLVPLMTLLTDLEEDKIFPTSVAIILPVCIVSLWFQGNPLPFRQALPYLIGSIGGGVLAGVLAKNIPTVWLHRLLGILILWGGIRYLC